MKKVGIILGVMISAIVLGFGINHSNASQAEPQLSSEEIKEIVSNEYPGEIIDLTLSEKENEAVYTVNVDANETVYELEMDGNTGEVLELRETPITNKDQFVIDEDKDKGQNKDENKNKNKNKNKTKTKAGEKEKKKTSDRQKDAAKETESKKPSKQKTVKKEQERKETEEKSTAISIDEAVDIALSKFTGQVTEVEVEEEDGRLIYEVEIESGEEEAEIEIDAHTGEVIVIEIDRD